MTCPARSQELLTFRLDLSRDEIILTTYCPHCESILEYSAQFDDTVDDFTFHWPDDLTLPTQDQLDAIIAHIDLQLQDKWERLEPVSFRGEYVG